jgi:WD40 repeat protein
MENKALAAEFSGHQGAVYSLEAGFKPGTFWSAGGDGLVAEWNLKKPDEGRLLARMPGSVYALGSLKDSGLLVVAVNRDGFHFLDPEAGTELFSIASPAHQWFRLLPLSSGKMLAAGSGGALALLDATERSIRYFQFGSADIRSLTRIPASGEILLGTSQPSLLMLNDEFNSVIELASGHEKTIFGLSAFPDSSGIITAGRDARLHLHRMNNSGNWEILHSVAAHLYGIHDVKLHSEKPLLASASMDKTVKIWDAENLRLLRVLDRGRHGGHSHSVNQLCWLADSDLLLSCSDDRKILAWNIYE